MTRLVLLAIDLVAVSLLVFGLYFPRYRRRDLVVAYAWVHKVTIERIDLVNDTTVVEVRYSHQAKVNSLGDRAVRVGTAR